MTTRDSLDPRKQSYRKRVVTKITQSSGLRKSTKVTPKCLPKWSPKSYKRLPGATPGAVKKKTRTKHDNGFTILSKRRKDLPGGWQGDHTITTLFPPFRETRKTKSGILLPPRDGGAPHFRTEAWKIEKKTPKCRKRLQPKSHLTARAPTPHHQCGKNDQVPPQGGQMWPKASQKLPKVTPKLSLSVPKCVFQKLRLDCACVGRSHVGPGQSAPRHRPKRHPPERSTKMPSKTDVGGAFGWQWGAFAAQGSHKGLPRAPKHPPNIDEHLPSGPPGLHLPAFGALLEGPETPNPQIA